MPKQTQRPQLQAAVRLRSKPRPPKVHCLLHMHFPTNIMTRRADEQVFLCVQQRRQRPKMTLFRSAS